MKNNFYVYQYIDPETLLPFYIGKGKGTRMYVHLNETKENTNNLRKYKYIQYLKNKNLDPIIEKVKENLTSDEAYTLEAKLISKYGRKGIDKNGVLTNICLDARPPLKFGKAHHNYGGKVSVPDEQKRRNNISKTKTGKPNGQKGLKKSTNMKEKLSATRSGIVLSESTRKKLSEANKGKNNPNFGTFWITNGRENKKVKTIDNLPEGWTRGRTVNHIIGFKGAKNVRT